MLKSATTPSLRRRSLGGRIVRRPLLALAACTAAGAAALFPAQALAGTAVETYSTPGETAFVVPNGVSQIHIDAFGAAGGTTSVAGGAGAEVQGDLSVSPGETLFLEVGIGGGAGGLVSDGVAGGDGGGASDVRTCSIRASSCTVAGYGSASSAQTRLLVAAGGGGAGYAQLPGPIGAGPGGAGGLLNGAGGAGGYSGTGDPGTGASVGLPGFAGYGPYGPGGIDGDTDGLGFGGGGGRGGGGGGGGGGYHGGGGGTGSTRWEDPMGGLHADDYGAGGGGGSSWVNQDVTGIGAYLTHITGASSALGSGPARIVISYPDFTSPSVSVEAPSTGQVVGPRPTLSGTGGSDLGDHPEVSISIYSGQTATGSPVQKLAGPIDAAHRYQVEANAPLASGTYTAMVTQQDDAGNTGTALASFVVDADGPIVSITAPTDGSVYHDGDSAPAAYSCTDAGAGVAACAGQVADGQALDTSTPGLHSFTVLATDRVGNLSSRTVHYTVLGSGQQPRPQGTPQPQQQGTPGPGASAGGRSAPAVRASSNLRVLTSHLRALPRGCSQHPRPRHLAPGACARVVVASGSIDPRATGQRLMLTWKDGWGHVKRATATVRNGGRWSSTLGLPSRGPAGSVVIAYAGNSALLPSTARRQVAPAH
jgi:hypothetical protein